ncbi:hypothetical protein ABPG74_006066 [Tetrahymena malaccensis]
MLQETQNPQQLSDDKQMLIHSMAKLLEHIYKNKEHQEEIFYSFLEDDLQKLLQNMEDSNIKLRKVSARFLCELLHNSVENQHRFCNLLDITTISGGICINQIPSTFVDILRQNPSLFDIIQRKQNFIQENMKEQPNSERPLCWFITLQQLYTQDVEPQFFYKKSNQQIDDIINDFLDPETAIFGISIYNDKCPHPSNSSRNSFCANNLIEDNSVNKITPLPHSNSTKNMSNLNKSIEVNTFKRTETHEKSPIKYASPHNFKKYSDGNFMNQVRNSLQVQNQQGLGIYDQKRCSMDQFGLQNEQSSLISQSLNFKLDYNFHSFNKFRSSLSPKNNNISANNSQLSQLNNQSLLANKQQTKFGSQYGDKQSPFYDYNFIPHQQINLLDGIDNLNSNRNKQQQDLSASTSINKQQILQQKQSKNSSIQNEYQQQNGLDLLGSQRDFQFQSLLESNQFQQSTNYRNSQINSESQFQQPESLFQSILTQKESISHQTSVNSIQKGSEFISNSQLNLKQNQQPNQIKEQNENVIRGGGSPQYKNSSNSYNKYFISPDQRNNQTKKTNSSMSKEHNYEQKAHNCSVSNSTNQQNVINHNQPNSVYTQNFYSINSQQQHQHHYHHLSSHQYTSKSAAGKTNNTYGSCNINNQTTNSTQQQISTQGLQQTKSTMQKQTDDPSNFLVSSKNGNMNSANSNEQGQNGIQNSYSQHSYTKSKISEQQNRLQASKQASLVSYKQLSNNASNNDSAYLKSVTGYNNSIQGSFVKEIYNMNEAYQKTETNNIDKNEYQFQDKETQQLIPNLSQFRSSLDSQINIYSSIISNQSNNEIRLSLQKSPIQTKPRRTSNGQTSIQLELTDLDSNQIKKNNKLQDNRVLQQKNEILSSNDISSSQIKNNLQMSQSTRETTNPPSNFQLNLHRGTATNNTDFSSKNQPSNFKNLVLNQNTNNDQKDQQNINQKGNLYSNYKGSSSNSNTQQDKKKVPNNGLTTSQDHFSLKKITQSITSASPKLNLVISPRHIASQSVKENQIQNNSKPNQFANQQTNSVTTSTNSNSTNTQNQGLKQVAVNSNNSNNLEILQSRKSHDLWMMNYIIQSSKRKNSYDITKTGGQTINNLANQSKGVQNQNNNNGMNDKQHNKACTNNKVDQKLELNSNKTSEINQNNPQKSDYLKKNSYLNTKTNEKGLQINTQVRAVSPSANLVTSQTSKFHKSTTLKEDFKSPQQSIRKKMIM